MICGGENKEEVSGKNRGSPYSYPDFDLGSAGHGETVHRCDEKRLENGEAGRHQLCDGSWHYERPDGGYLWAKQDADPGADLNVFTSLCNQL